MTHSCNNILTPRATNTAWDMSFPSSHPQCRSSPIFSSHKYTPTIFPSAKYTLPIFCFSNFPPTIHLFISSTFPHCLGLKLLLLPPVSLIQQRTFLTKTIKTTYSYLFNYKYVSPPLPSFIYVFSPSPR